MYSIIVIDDEPTTPMAIKDYINKTNKDFYVAATFSNGQDAVAYLLENPVNVVITDIYMPEMDGLELSSYIHDHFPHISIIIISGYSEFEYARRAIEYGVSSYLLKPFNFQELSQKLRAIADQLNILNTKNYEKEEVPLFFSDLIDGAVSNKDELYHRFSALDFEGNPEDYSGYIIYIDLDSYQYTNWAYERETLSTAIFNCLQMACDDSSVYYLYRIGIRYYFVILSLQKKDLALSLIEKNIQDLLHLKSSVTIKTEFKSIPSLQPTIRRKPEAKIFSAGEGNQHIQRAIEYIQTHYSEDITREDVANTIYVAPVYFSSLFKQKTGLSFIDYLTTIRMQKAIELLKTRMKVSEISQKVGYQSRNRFYINFRQYTGYTPTEYRKQILFMEDFNEKTEE